MSDAEEPNAEVRAVIDELERDDVKPWDDCSHSYATWRGDPYHVMCIPPPRSRIDPRDPDWSRPGIFATHNCWKCRDGSAPHRCPTPERPGNCGYPHARND